MKVGHIFPHGGRAHFSSGYLKPEQRREQQTTPYGHLPPRRRLARPVLRRVLGRRQPLQTPGFQGDSPCPQPGHPSPP
eukprot:131576-Chlamydomonas_euryale.AAC.4